MTIVNVRKLKIYYTLSLQLCVAFVYALLVFLCILSFLPFLLHVHLLFICLGLIIYLVFSFNMAFSSFPLPTLLQKLYYFFYNNDHRRRYSVNIWLIYIRMRVESFPCSKELKMTLIMICQNYSLVFSFSPFPLIFPPCPLLLFLLLNLRY